MLKLLKEEEINYNKELIERLSNEPTKYAMYRQNPYKGWAVLKQQYGWKIGAYTPEGRIEIYPTQDTGFRFVANYRNIPLYIPNQKLTKIDDRFIEVEYCEYPQEPVESEKQSKLDSEMFQGKLYETGKTYQSNDIVYHKPYCLVEVVDENREKYVLKNQVWYKVQPVKWIVDLKTGMAMSKYIMNGNIYFGDLNPTMGYYQYLKERGQDLDGIIFRIDRELVSSILPKDLSELKPAVHPSMYIHEIRRDETEEYKRLIKAAQS